MDFEVHPVGTATRLAALEYDTPEAIAITDKAARELLVREKLLNALKCYLKAGIHQSTDFQTQLEAYYLAKDAIKEAEAL